MKQKSYGGIVVILFICILAFCCGAVGGMFHIGEEFSKEIMPISVSTPIDTVSTIDEQDFEAKNITVQLYVPKPVVQNTTKTTTRNYTNTTNKTNTTPSRNTSYNNSTN